MIHIFCSSRYKISQDTIERSAKRLLDKHGVSPSTVLNIAFVGKRKMKEIANTYKHEDVALPVLSFSYLNDPAHSEEKILGEVVVCYPQAVLLAAEREKRVDIMLDQLIEHGILNILKPTP